MVPSVRAVNNVDQVSLDSPRTSFVFSRSEKEEKNSSTRRQSPNMAGVTEEGSGTLDMVGRGCNVVMVS